MILKRIMFTAHYGDVQKKVELFEPLGSADGGCHVMIDHFYNGTLVKLKGEWVLHYNKTDLYSEDILILGAIIDEQL